MKHKFNLTILILFLIICSNFSLPQSIISQPAYLVLEDFQKYNENPFTSWTCDEDINVAKSIYSIVQENGSRYLRGSTVDKNFMVQIGKQFNQNAIVGKNKINWNIYSFPCLSWDWRVRILPSGGNERDDDSNDSAAAIYVVFQKSRIPFAGWQRQPANWIKYVWSSTLPVGTVVTKKITRFGFFLYEGKYVVVASGNRDMGKWITLKRDVLADYRTYFGGNPAFQPSVVGILTDSNSTGSKAEADYDNIKAFAY